MVRGGGSHPIVTIAYVRSRHAGQHSKYGWPIMGTLERGQLGGRNVGPGASGRPGARVGVGASLDDPDQGEGSSAGVRGYTTSLPWAGL